MRKFLARIPFPALLVIAIFLAIAPITPQPHLSEKLGMLLRGDLVRPIDTFDLLFHAAPLMLLALKLTLERNSGQNQGR
jgi:hypothetical protein